MNYKIRNSDGKVAEKIKTFNKNNAAGNVKSNMTKSALNDTKKSDSSCFLNPSSSSKNCSGCKVLIVDDDDTILDLMAFTLNKYKCDISTAKSAECAWDLIKQGESFHMIIMDYVLPAKSGLDLCKDIRKLEREKHLKNKASIIMLTAKSTYEDKITAYESTEIDEYITKPFIMSEFMGRFLSVLRRSSFRSSEDVLRVGNIMMDIGKRKVEVDGVNKNLSAREFDLLMLFMKNPDIVYSRKDLLEAVWGDKHVDIRTIDVHINRVRSALFNIKNKRDKGVAHCSGRQPIKTIRGSGYSLTLDDSPMFKSPEVESASTASDSSYSEVIEGEFDSE